MLLGRIMLVRESRSPRGVSVDLELLIRLMEWAREEAADDVALHRVAEGIESLAADGATLTMDDYERIMGELAPAEEVIR